jgi:hypothetical protein
MTLYVAPVVEGQTEQACVERLLQRVWGQLLGAPERLQVLEPFRGQRDALVHPDGAALTDCVRKAFLKLNVKAGKDPQARRLLLVLLDAEGDLPCQLAPRLLGVVRAALPAGAPVACVLPRRMLENWIVAGASTLAGVNGLPDALPAGEQFEDRSGAGWLEEQLRSRDRTRKYKKTVDAEAFVRAMNLHECRANAPSFDKLCRELEALLPQQPDAPAPGDESAPPATDAGTSP